MPRRSSSRRCWQQARGAAARPQRRSAPARTATSASARRRRRGRRAPLRGEAPRARSRRTPSSPAAGASARPRRAPRRRRARRSSARCRAPCSRSRSPRATRSRAGQVLCVVEAMKMENEITAHRAGRRDRRSRSPPGEPVTTGQVICVVAPGRAGWRAEWPFCAAVSRASAASRSPRPRAGSTTGSSSSTAGLWDRDVLGGSLLSPEAQGAPARAARTRSRPSRLLFVKKPERRAHGRRHVYFGVVDGRRGAAPRARGRRTRRTCVGVDFGRARRRRGAGRPGRRTRSSSSARTGSATAAARGTAGPLYDALRADRPGRVWQSTHVGGDRFAGNVVVAPAGALLRAGRAGRRRGAPRRPMPRAGSTSTATAAAPRYPFPVQAAEQRDPRDGGPPRASTTSLLGPSAAARTPGACASARRTARPSRSTSSPSCGEPVYLTCGAAEPSRPRRFRATGRRRSDVTTAESPRGRGGATRTSRPSSSSSPGSSAGAERIVGLEAARPASARGVRGEARSPCPRRRG